MRDATDREILAGAAADGRVCVTLDKDFHEALDRSRATYPSVILLRWQKLRADGVAEVIDATLTRHAAELRSGVAITVSQRATRVRNLPLGPPSPAGKVRFSAVPNMQNPDDVRLFIHETNSPVSHTQPQLPPLACQHLYVARAGLGKPFDGLFHPVPVAVW